MLEGKSTRQTAHPLRLENVQKIFPGSQSGVHELNIDIAPGEGFSLLGPSGCGKSTTLRIIGGFEAPDQGRVFHGQEITQLPPQKRDIRTVFQRYALFPHLTVEENVAFGLRMQKRTLTEIQAKARWAMGLLEIARLASRPIQKLSGGEQQRVAVARALVTEPSILLLDEPLSALDLKLREKMQLELLALRHKLGTTFIFVTHDQNEAMALSDRIAVMKEGRIMQTGSPEEIYQRPNSRFVAEFIGQANFLPAAKAQLLSGDRERLPRLEGNREWMVRPEHFNARDAEWQAPAGFVTLPVRIVETAFLGQDRLTKAVDEGGTPYLLKTPGFEKSPGRPNEKILLAWETEDTWTVGSS
jgi:spermidine/putrescine transport system ATP-binding protein